MYQLWTSRLLHCHDFEIFWIEFLVQEISKFCDSLWMIITYYSEHYNVKLHYIKHFSSPLCSRKIIEMQKSFYRQIHENPDTSVKNHPWDILTLLTCWNFKLKEAIWFWNTTELKNLTVKRLSSSLVIKSFHMVDSWL